MSHSEHGEIDGNAVLYAGTWALINQKVAGKYEWAICLEEDLYNAVKVLPGLIGRGNKPKDPQTHDDYIGMLTLSALTANKIAAKEIYEYGNLKHWSYVNVAYSFSDLFNAQFWRLPGVVQHIKACAGIEWTTLDYLLFSLSVIGNIFTSKEETSGKILTWHMVSIYERNVKRAWFSDWAVSLWKHRILKIYPNAMGDVFGIYFGKDHIFSKYTIGVI